MLALVLALTLALGVVLLRQSKQPWQKLLSASSHLRQHLLHPWMQMSLVIVAVTILSYHSTANPLPTTLWAREAIQNSNSMNIIVDQQKTTQTLNVLEKIGQTLRPSSGWLDTAGQTVNLEQTIRADAQKKKPTILIPSYFTCKRVCPFVMQDLAKALDRIDDLQPGADYNLISVSINPMETKEDALLMKTKILETFQEKNIKGADWLFLRAPDQIPQEAREKKIDSLMADLGYPFQKDGDEFFHSAVIVFINHAYQINRYFYGIEYLSADIRLSLVEASELQLGKSIDRLRLYCFRYDPTTGRYTALMRNLMRVGAALTLFFLLSVLLAAIFIKKRKDA